MPHFKSLLMGFVLLCVMGARAAEVDLSRAHYPMLQGNTSDTETFLNVLVPRIKDFSFRAVPAGARGAKPIDGQLIGEPLRDPQGLLHEKVLRVKFSGLSPKVEYELEMSEVSHGHGQVVDRRRFQTLDTSPRPLKFVAASCFCDEIRYEAARQKIWSKVVEQKPDLIIMMGDQTYMDSFDYVERNKATDLDIWMRGFRSFSENPIFRSQTLIPVLATWDDHDTGVDNGNSLTPTLKEARRLFQALYGSEDIAGVFEGSKEGVQRYAKIAGLNFVLLDNRSFRTPPDEKDRYGHLGREQEEWLIEKMGKEKGPFLLFNGDMWGSPTLMGTTADGKPKRLTESFFGDHPLNYNELMNRLHETGRSTVFFSGDIHFSQIISHGPEWKGTSRHAPYNTVEITSSPAHSFIFEPKPGEEVLWKDDQRIVGTKEYNVLMVQSTALEDGGVDLTTSVISQKDKPSFEYGTRVTREEKYKSNRRQLLSRDFSKTNGLVKVAFFDADDTLRVALSKNVSANGPTDVLLLPNVAKKIERLTKLGYLNAIVSKQRGIDVGKVSLGVVDQAFLYTIALIQGQAPKAVIHYYDFSEHGKEDFYAKPNIGQAKHLERVLKREGLAIDWDHSFMVGDAQYSKDEVTPDGLAGEDFSDSDRKFAENLRIKTFHPRDFFDWTQDQRAAIKARDYERLASLSSGCAQAVTKK